MSMLVGDINIFTHSNTMVMLWSRKIKKIRWHLIFLGDPWNTSEMCQHHRFSSGLPSVELLKFSARFTEQEIWNVIKALPSDKALGSDGFTTRFLQVAWSVIRPDIMRVLSEFS
jgi:hypothetical protein